MWYNIGMEDLNYDMDRFPDILSKDDRYSPNAYTLVMDVVGYLLGEGGRSHVSGEDILEEFRARALDLFGPMTYRVLAEWGVACCEDVGEMMFNLAESGRIKKDENDTPEAFAGGYDFKEVFLGPYAPGI